MLHYLQGLVRRIGHHFWDETRPVSTENVYSGESYPHKTVAKT